MALAQTCEPDAPAAYVLAKVCGSLAFASVVAALLFGVAAIGAHVRMPATHWASLAIVLVLGTLPFCALGLALGLLVRPTSAASTVNLVYLPMSFCAGLWVPITQLPPSLQAFAPVLPTYHLGRLALAAVGFSSGSVLVHIAVLLAWTVAGIAVATWAFARDTGRTYG